MTCNCEPLAVTLVRARLWPATPHHPKYAFTFNLLDLAESMLLECQVALRDFCNALYFRSPHPVLQVSNGSYQTNVFWVIGFHLCREEMYILPWSMLSKNTGKSPYAVTDMYDYKWPDRFFKHDSRHLSHLLGGSDSGNVCPACPKVGSYSTPTCTIYTMYMIIGRWKNSVLNRCLVWTSSKKVSWKKFQTTCSWWRVFLWSRSCWWICKHFQDHQSKCTGKWGCCSLLLCVVVYTFNAYRSAVNF